MPQKLTFTKTLQFKLSPYFLQIYKISEDFEFCESFLLNAIGKDNLPAKKKGNVEDWAVQVDKLEEEHFQSKAVFPFRFCSRVFFRKTQYTLYKQKWNWVMHKFAHKSINTNKIDSFKSWCPITLQLISFHCPSSDYVVSMWKQKIEASWFRINYNTVVKNLFHFHEKIWKLVCIFLSSYERYLDSKKKTQHKRTHHKTQTK